MILRDLGEEEALYRFIVPRWSHAPTSGAGAAVKGGRFNRPRLEALYLSQTAETAEGRRCGEGCGGRCPPYAV